MDSSRFTTASSALVAVGASSLQVLEAEGLQPLLNLTPRDSTPAQASLPSAAAGEQNVIAAKSTEGAVFSAQAVCLLGRNGSVAVAASQRKPQLLIWSLVQPGSVRHRALPGVLTSLCSDEEGAFLFGGDAQGVLRVWQINSLLVSSGTSFEYGSAGPKGRVERSSPVAFPSILETSTLTSCLRASVAVAEGSIVGLYIQRELLVVAARGGILKAFRWIDILNRQSSSSGVNVHSKSTGSVRSGTRPHKNWRGVTGTVCFCKFMEGPALHKRSSRWLLLAASDDCYVRAFSPDSDDCVAAFALPERPESLVEDSLRPCEPRVFVGGTAGSIFVLPIPSAMPLKDAESPSLQSQTTRSSVARDGLVLRARGTLSDFNESNSSSSSRSLAPLVLSGHSSPVKALAILNARSESRTLLSGGSDGYRVWDVETLSCLYTVDHPALTLPTEGMLAWGCLSSVSSRRFLPDVGLLAQQLQSQGSGWRGGDSTASVATCLFERRALRRGERRAALLELACRRRALQSGEEGGVSGGPRRLHLRLRQLQTLVKDSAEEFVGDEEKTALKERVLKVEQALQASNKTLDALGSALRQTIPKLQRATALKAELTAALASKGRVGASSLSKNACSPNLSPKAIEACQLDSAENSSADDGPVASRSDNRKNNASSKLRLIVEAVPSDVDGDLREAGVKFDKSRLASAPSPPTKEASSASSLLERKKKLNTSGRLASSSALKK